MNQWTNGAVIQWSDDSTNHGTVNPWIQESMNQWMNAWWMDGEVDEWMKGWLGGWALLLCWTSSSLSDLFAQVPLLSAILLLCTSALACFPATSSVASAAQSSLHLFARPAQCILQAPLQLRIVQTRHMAEKLPFAQLLQCALQPPATASHSIAASEHLCLAARSHANAICHSWFLIRIAGGPHQIDQHWRSVDNRHDSAPLEHGGFLRLVTSFCEIDELSLQSGGHFADLIC